MVGALLTVVILAQVGEGRLDREYPDQMIGLMPRFGMGALAGDGASDLTNPIAGWGGSLQIRLAERIYLDVSGDTRLPTAAEAETGKILMGVDQQFAGIRFRQPLDPKSNVVFGAGAGAFAFIQYGGEQNERLDAGPAAYGMAGYERQVFGSDGSGSYIGFELSWSHYFPGSDAPLTGGLAEGRVTFSYYFGGREAADCL